MSDTSIDFTAYEKGDYVLYSGRKQPLQVTGVRDDQLTLQGPQGGEYVLFLSDDGETLLEASPGNKQYASKIEDLRNVGHWEEEDDNSYRHTGSNDTVDVIKNDAGFWTVETTLDVDLPAYGFTEKEQAEQEAAKIVRDNPTPEQ